MGKLKLVIFDMDGLMFDTEMVGCRAFLEVTREKNLSGTKEQYMGLVGMNSPDIIRVYQELYGLQTDPEVLYYEIGDRMKAIIQEEGLPVKKGLYEILDEVEALSLKKAVASGSDMEVITANLVHAGISSRFDLVSTSSGVKRGKPYPDVFLAVCEQLSVFPEEALVLEDSPKGVEAALAGGIPVIQVPDCLTLPPILKERCLAVCPSLLEVIPVLRGIR